jgi:DNA-binding LacI/PurR family transcriptional regulator
MASEGAHIGRITIKEVAEAAGVSRSSVSNYLNERFANMGLETRERIADAIKKLEYRPNSAARQLKTGKVPMIGLLVPTVINPFYCELALAVEQAASKYNYRILLCNTMSDPVREREFEEELLSHGIRGLITVSPIVTKRSPSLSNMAMVAIDAKRSDLRTTNADIINIDNIAASRMAVDHLVMAGHRHIAYVTDPATTFSRAYRMAGFQAAVNDHGLDSCPVMVVEPEIGSMTYSEVALFELGQSSLAHVLNVVPRPTAIVALNDMIAVGILSALHASGLSVPADMSVVGIDDILLARLTSPMLTTVRQPIELMAETAVERLVKRLGDSSRSASEVVFQPEFTIRNSTQALISG